MNGEWEVRWNAPAQAWWRAMAGRCPSCGGRCDYAEGFWLRCRKGARGTYGGQVEFQVRDGVMPFVTDIDAAMAKMIPHQVPAEARRIVYRKVSKRVTVAQWITDYWRGLS